MGNHSKCYRCGELDEYCVCAAAHPVAGSPAEAKKATLGDVWVSGGVHWDLFPGYLIDHCEGDRLTEEGLQLALSRMLKDADYLRMVSERAAEPMSASEAPDLPENWKVREAVNRKRRANMISDAAVGEIMTAVRDLMPSTRTAAPVPASEAASQQSLPQSECNAALRAAPAGQHYATAADAADFIDKRAEEYLNGNAGTEADTGAVTWHFGDAGRDYYNTLIELAEEIRGLNPPVSALIEAGALRQFRHNDGSEGFVFAYDKAITDRMFAQHSATDWVTLARRLYVELFHCHQQMMNETDENDEPLWLPGVVVPAVLADAKQALELAARFRAEGGITNDSTTHFAAPAAPTDARPASQEPSFHWMQRAFRAELGNASTTDAKDSEILMLHRQLAAEKLRADQGWERYEAANRDRNSLRSAIAAQSVRDAAQPTIAAEDVRDAAYADAEEACCELLHSGADFQPTVYGCIAAIRARRLTAIAATTTPKGEA